MATKPSVNTGPAQSPGHEMDVSSQSQAPLPQHVPQSWEHVQHVSVPLQNPSGQDAGWQAAFEHAVSPHSWNFTPCTPHESNQ